MENDRANGSEIRTTVTAIYFLLIFLMFPLYVENRYQAMGDCKWRFYCAVTVPYLAVMLLMALPGLAKVVKDRRRPVVGICDLLVGAYGIFVLVSFAFCGDRQAVWLGAEGWHMGVAAQLLFVLSYFVLSRSRIPVSWLVVCNAAGSGVCFLIGILQRLGYDFLNLYEGLPNVAVSDFLSTIGNRTWMSGYACAVFPIGVYLFWKTGADIFGAGVKAGGRDWMPGGNRWQLLLWGGYSALAFTGLAAAYSDSAYIGLGIVFLALGILSVGDRGKMFSFCQVLCLWFGSSLFMCGVRALRRGYVRDERGLSVYVYNWRWMLAGLMLCVLFTVAVVVFYARGRGQSGVMSAARRGRLQRRCAAASAVCGVLLVLLIVCNTTGLLERIFSVTLHSPYLYFDDAWGDMRGWTWKMVCRMFGELPFWNKLFGVGADGFVYYCYGSLEYARELSEVWGNVILTNAHNEWLNMFFCQGILGGLAYLGIFAGGIIACLCGTQGRAEPVAQAVGLCLLAYASHNFFCYQQICATGPIFILLGAAMSLLRENTGDTGNTGDTER